MDPHQSDTPTRSNAGGEEGRNHTGIIPNGSIVTSGEPANPGRTARGWRRPPQRTTCPISKNGIRAHLRDGTEVGVGPALIEAARQAMMDALDDIRRRAWRGRELEAARYERDPAPELALRHLAMDSNVDAPASNEDPGGT